MGLYCHLGVKQQASSWVIGLPGKAHPDCFHCSKQLRKNINLNLKSRGTAVKRLQQQHYYHHRNTTAAPGWQQHHCSSDHVAAHIRGTSVPRYPCHSVTGLPCKLYRPCCSPQQKKVQSDRVPKALQGQALLYLQQSMEL